MALMESIRRIFHYLANLQWTEKKQKICLFCDRNRIENVSYEDDEIIIFENIKSAGSAHWLVAPREHIRDIEALTAEHVSILKAMNAAKIQLQAKYPSETKFHCGYHRGRRSFFGLFTWPDIISVHHLHLHVIVNPHPWLNFFKYPWWLPLMWKSDRAVLREAERRGRLPIQTETGSRAS